MSSCTPHEACTMCKIKSNHITELKARVALMDHKARVSFVGGVKMSEYMNSSLDQNVMVDGENVNAAYQCNKLEHTITQLQADLKASQADCMRVEGERDEAKAQTDYAIRQFNEVRSGRDRLKAALERVGTFVADVERHWPYTESCEFMFDRSGKYIFEGSEDERG